MNEFRITPEERAHLLTLRAERPARSAALATASAPDLGQRVADRVAAVVGSWRFIIVQSTLLLAWIALNVVAYVQHWDPYPFILLNLALSFQAAYAAPIIMMSQNRQSVKDRLQSDEDYHVNLRAEAEVAAIQRQLEALAAALATQQQSSLAVREEHLRLLREIHATLVVDRAAGGGGLGERGR
jgi:uncharacterized membrane protein